MSTEEIIHAWKHNEDDAKKQPKGEKPLKEEKQLKGDAPSNPAGTQELSDEDLAAVEGGLAPMTCNVLSC